MNNSGLKQNDKRGSARRECNVWKGLAAGVVGGLVASWTMNQFQALWSKLAEGEERSHGAQSMQQGHPQQGIGRELQAEGKDDAEDDAAERLANAISVGISGRELTKSEKDVAGVVFHYAMGATSGALYGAVAEALPQVTAGAGLPFGAAVWAIADEGIVPAVGLSKSPTEYPLSIHAYAFTSHLVFGLTTELVRRAVREAM
jgi:putative membrane protein